MTNKPSDLNLSKIVDPSTDETTANLADVWEAIATPIYRVVDEQGVNVAAGQIRRLTDHLWLYVDETDGYDVMDWTDVSRLYAVPAASHTPLGWDAAGNVVIL